MENDPYLTRKGRFWGYTGIMIIIAAVLVFAIIAWENFQEKTRLSDSISKQKSDPPPTAWNGSSVTSTNDSTLLLGPTNSN